MLKLNTNRNYIRGDHYNCILHLASIYLESQSQGHSDSEWWETLYLPVVLDDINLDVM